MRVETMQSNVEVDVKELKEMFRTHATDEANSYLRLHERIDEMSEDIKAVSESQIAMKANLDGRVWGMRAAWAGIIAIGALVWKLVQNQQA